MYNLKIVKSTHGEVLLSEKVLASAFAGFNNLQPATFLKVTLLLEYFLRFLNCANGNKSRKASHVLS